MLNNNDKCLEGCKEDKQCIANCIGGGATKEDVDKLVNCTLKYGEDPKFQANCLVDLKNNIIDKKPDKCTEKCRSDAKCNKECLDEESKKARKYMKA